MPCRMLPLIVLRSTLPRVLQRGSLGTSRDLSQADGAPHIGKSIGCVQVYSASRLAKGRSTDQSRPATQADSSLMGRLPITRNDICLDCGNVDCLCEVNDGRRQVSLESADDSDDSSGGCASPKYDDVTGKDGRGLETLVHGVATDGWWSFRF